MPIIQSAHMPSMKKARQHSRQDYATQTAALVAELVALLDADALGLALGDELLVGRIGELDPLFDEWQLLQIAAPRRPFLLIPRVAVVAVLVGIVILERAGERIELTEL